MERVSYYLETPVAEIDPGVSLAEYGLESVYAFALCGDIEDTLGVTVEPTLVWDVDTVAAPAWWPNCRRPEGPSGPSRPTGLLVHFCSPAAGSDGVLGRFG
ncbi:acyl carrier protein [Streptomyces sp.]|uniref:acyl carrier protein n=1 Tax=Streptomyces sp. TaxID=1931 RepID=UPI0025ED1202|nr:acyl carrier protein [Streptomyces sp.]